MTQSTHQDRRGRDQIREAPHRLLPVLKQLGPGLIIAGSIVGSGELIATTKTGAQAGITLLWLIILGCVVKVFVQIEMGRHTITHGQTSLAALNQVPGKLGRVNWIVAFWFAMMMSSVVQLGGIVGGVGQAAAIAMPITGDYREAIRMPSEKEIAWLLRWEVGDLSQHEEFQLKTPAEQERIRQGTVRLRTKIDALGDRGTAAMESVRNSEKLSDPYTWDDKIWATLAALITIALLVNGRYSLIQNLTTVLVVTFTLVTIGNFVSLQATADWSISSAEMMQGLTFHLPTGDSGMRPLATALATFGIIGVGAAELVAYPYWCLEKGYAVHTGPREETDEWRDRARGWLRVMHIDVLLSMIVYTVATVAFYLVGVAVLYRTGSDPEGMRMTSTLAEAYVPIFGEYARWLFLTGAIAVLYSTFLVANASHTRMYTDFLKLLGWLNPDSETAHWKSIRTFGVIVPSVCLFVFCSNVRPDAAVLASGIMQALLLPMLGIGAIFFRYWQTDPRLRPSAWFDVLLILSCLSFFVTGLWGAWENGQAIYEYCMKYWVAG